MATCTPKVNPKNEIMYYVHIGIMLALMFGIGQLPATAPITPIGMKLLGTFLGMLYGWISIGLIGPSLVGIISAGLSGYYPSVLGAFTAGFGNWIVVFCVFILTFVAILDATGLNIFIANWFVSRKIAVGRPWVFSILILGASYFLGFFVGCFASMFLMWSIFYSISQEIGYKPRDKYVSYMLVGIIYSVALGYCLPFRSTQLVVLGNLESLTGLSVNFFTYTFMVSIFNLICFTIFILAGKFVIKPDMTPLLSKEDRYAHLRHIKMSGEQKFGCLFLVAFMVMLFLPSILPADNGLCILLNKFGSVGSVALLVTIMVLVRSKGKNFADFMTSARKGVSWDLILMFVAVMPLSAALGSPEAGVMNFCVDRLRPHLIGLSVVGFMAAMIAVSYTMTNFCNDMATATLVSPIAITFAQALGFDPVAISVLLAFCLNISFLTPSASGPAAMIFSNQEWIAPKYAWTLSPIIFLSIFLTTLFAGIPLALLLF